MLITIVMTVCLYADGRNCRDERIEYQGSAMGCVIEAQPIVAEWSTDHPDWRVARWKCTNSG